MGNKKTEFGNITLGEINKMLYNDPQFLEGRQPPIRYNDPQFLEGRQPKNPDKLDLAGFFYMIIFFLTKYLIHHTF
ncbi:MAG TPA: hypothetical protein PLS84_11315 [Salinivirgaceae bacterium]|nr:hypothetical protein [Salinivirgaceae bacterium]